MRVERRLTQRDCAAVSPASTLAAEYADRRTAISRPFWFGHEQALKKKKSCASDRAVCGKGQPMVG